MDKETEDKFKSLMTDKGLLVNGIGILVDKLDILNKTLDRNNFLTSMVEKKLDKLIELEQQKLEFIKKSKE